MHEKRNFLLVILMTAGFFWTAWAWIYSDTQGVSFVKIASTLITLLLGGWLTYALTMEDKLPNTLLDYVGSQYFEADGVCVFPVIRTSEVGPELSIYYQNRFENPASVIVHLRPTSESFVVVPNATDVHIAFIVAGGDVGIIHQPIQVPTHLQGEIVELHMVAVSYYPRSHGTKLRSQEGRPSGSMNVDWAGNAMRTGAHEVDGTIELKQPVTLHLAMPRDCSKQSSRIRTWRQEILPVV